MTTPEATTAVSGNVNGNGPAVDPLQQRIDDGPKGGARTWYEVLDVGVDASDEDLLLAYDRALSLVEGRSIGGYLMLDPLAAESARADVETAFAVLGDTARRAAYDEKLRAREAEARSEAREGAGKAASKSSPPSAAGTTPPSAAATTPPRGAERVADEEVREARAMLDIAEAQTLVPGHAPADGVEPAPAPVATTAPPRTATPSALKFLAPTVAEEPVRRPATISSPSIRFEPPQAWSEGAGGSGGAGGSAGPEESGARPAGSGDASSGREARGRPADNDVPLAATPTVPPAATMPAPATAPPAPAVTGGAASLPEGEITGQLIRELREARGLSLDQLSEATKIRKAYLKAIEEGDISNLPTRVFLRGFLTQVGRVLKVDRARLADGYLQFVERHPGAGPAGA